MEQDIEQSIAYRAVQRRLVIAALSIATVLLIFDLCSLRRPWRRGEVNNADKLSLIITITNLGILCLRIPRSFSCWHPVVTFTVFSELYIISRGINILFFVHRAKSVQGPNPVLSQKWLTKYIPTFVCTYYGIGTLFVARSIDPKRIICVSNEFTYQRGAQQSMGVWVHSAVELILSAVVTILFVVPLWRLYRAGSNANHQQQQRSMRVLKVALKYAVVLSVINLLSSNHLLFGGLLYGDGDDHYMVWKFVRTLDPVINIVTTIMLFKRNRTLLWKVFSRIRAVLVQMCCFAYIMETDPHILDLQQAQRTAMILTALEDAAEANDLKIPTDSITEFNEVTSGALPVDIILSSINKTECKSSSRSVQ